MDGLGDVGMGVRKGDLLRDDVVDVGGDDVCVGIVP